MKIVYETTDICNGKCKHCYQRRGKKILIARDADQCRKDLELLLSQGHHINLGGAEVTTDERLFSLYQLIGQRYLLTNGINLASDPSMCSRIASFGITEVHISWHADLIDILDSIPESIIRQAISNALASGLSVKVLSVIAKNNFKKLFQIAETVRATGAKSIRFFQLMPATDEQKTLQLTEEERIETLRAVLKLREVYDKEYFRVEVHGTFDGTELTPNRKKDSLEGNFCPAGKSFICISTNNLIYPCPFLNDDNFVIGHWTGKDIVIERQLPHDGSVCLAKHHFI